MSADVTILAALVAGVVSFLSPCVLPLVPPYLVFLTGASIERLAGGEREPRVRREAVIAAMLFVAGFSTVFVALGASASVIGGMVRYYSHALSIVAGVAIIVMGLHFLGLTPISLLHRQARFDVQKPVGLWGAYVMGLAFALGWTPCIGPILAAILDRAIRRLRGALPFAPRACGTCDGRPARVDRHRVPRRLLHATQFLAAGIVSGVADDWVTQKRSPSG
jgi:cytochrome c-type biogenesis protein